MTPIKLAVFDLDSTLAAIGHGIPDAVVRKLHLLSDRGVRIAVCSGKTTPYLCGMMRQIELRDVIIMGEVGLTTQIGYEIPPKVHFSLPVDPVAVDALRSLKADIRDAFPGVWMQGNEITVTPFFSDTVRRDDVKAFLDRFIAPEMHLEVYEYQDCFDISPKGVDKGAALNALLTHLGMDARNVAAIGDGANDIPMFAVAGVSLLVGGKTGIAADFHTETMEQAMDLLLDMTQ